MSPLLPAYVQGVRGLLMCGLCLGFFAVVCCFVGMECTYIGGGNKTKDRFLLAGSVFHFIGGKDGPMLVFVQHTIATRPASNNECVSLTRRV